MAKNDQLIKKLENSFEERKHFKEAFAPAINQIGTHINEGHVLINIDLARVLLDYIAGVHRHDEELAGVVSKEKNKNIPAIERPFDAG